MLKEDRLIRSKIKDFRLLLEYVDRDVFIDSINDRYVLKIYYAGDETINRGWRTIEPYAMGAHRDTNNIVIRAWQQAGATDSGRAPNSKNEGLPGWRLFRLDGITSAYPMPNKHFAKDGVRPNYRKDGEDKHIKNVIAAVVAGSDNMAIDLKGISSYTDPDVIGTKLAKDDPDAAQVKKFYQDPSNQEDILQRRVADFYSMLKQNGRDPYNYVLTYKDGRYWYQRKGTRDYNKLKDEEIIGNLNNLYRKYAGTETFKIDKGFETQQRSGFENKLKKSTRR